MAGEEKRRGSTVVEAAILFPLILSLVIAGFALMVRWYDRWEKENSRLRQKAQEEEIWGNEQMIRWKQWKTMWRSGDDHEEG